MYFVANGRPESSRRRARSASPANSRNSGSPRPGALRRWPCIRRRPRLHRACRCGFGPGRVGVRRLPPRRRQARPIAWSPSRATGRNCSARPRVGRSPRRSARGVDLLRLEVAQPGRYVVRTAAGQRRNLRAGAARSAARIAGPWEVQFPGRRRRADAGSRWTSWFPGASTATPGVNYFSGTATYRKTFDVPAEAPGQRPPLVSRPGQGRGDGRARSSTARTWASSGSRPIAWTSPPPSEAGRRTALEVKVVNLWINRLIGDEQLPEDSDRNPDGTLKQWPNGWRKASPARPAASPSPPGGCRKQGRPAPLPPACSARSCCALRRRSR